MTRERKSPSSKKGRKTRVCTTAPLVKNGVWKPEK